MGLAYLWQFLRDEGLVENLEGLPVFAEVQGKFAVHLSHHGIEMYM